MSNFKENHDYSNGAIEAHGKAIKEIKREILRLKHVEELVKNFQGNL